MSLRATIAYLVLSWLVLWGAGVSDAHAQRKQDPPPPSGLRIHLRGTSEIQAAPASEPLGFSVSGVLRDDAGSPIAGASIDISARDREGNADVALNEVSPCSTPPRRARGDAPVAITTNDVGAFCVVVKSAPKKLVLKLKYRGDKSHDPAEREIDVDAGSETQIRTLVRFEPPPEVIDLDHETVTITASIHVDRGASQIAPQGPRREGIKLVLADERGRTIGEAITGGDGRARFEVKTADLDVPGKGELTLRFDGAPPLAKAVATQPITRRAEVSLALAHPIARADAEDGVPIDLDVTTRRGPVGSGAVEVRRIAGVSGVENVGAGAVAEGHAHAVAAFAAAGAQRATLQIRYVTAAPWYKPGPELRVEAPLAGPSVLRQIVIALAVLAAAVWVVAGWRRAPKPKLAPGAEPQTMPPSGRAGVHVLAQAAGATGWRGVVSDAHDGSPVAGARLSIVAPSFQGDGIVARAVADERGAFSLDSAHRSDARLIVESDHHSTHEQALPPPSVIGVALVTRRRALLERLVRWARRYGPPYDGAPEATPGHVRRAASRAGADAVEAWAKRVEHTVYGPANVSADAERELRDGEPRAVAGP